MKNRGKIKIALMFAALAVLIGGGIGGVYLARVNAYQAAVRETVIADVDIAQIPDGVYTGEYDVDFIQAKVEVRVRAGKIAEIALMEHKNDRGAAAERIVDAIIAEQTLQVDGITGATNSSTVIRKAVENALQP